MGHMHFTILLYRGWGSGCKKITGSGTAGSKNKLN